MPPAGYPAFHQYLQSGRVRNVITHLLSQIGYEELPREEVKLPKRQKGGDYQESNHPFRFVPEIY